MGYSVDYRPTRKRAKRAVPKNKAQRTKDIKNVIRWNIERLEHDTVGTDMVRRCFVINLLRLNKIAPEADPTGDIEGYDAANKAAIMATLGFHTSVTIDDVSVEGITKITADDIAAATAEHKVIKLLAVVENGEAGVSARVYPALIDENHPLASVHGSFNAVFVKAEAADDLMFYGRGAGGAPTASAVVGDVVTEARHIAAGCTGPSIPLYKNLPKAPITASKAAFAVRFLIHDKPGVLAAIAAEFAKNGVSINGVNQDLKPTMTDPGYDGEIQQLRVVTHLTDEETLRNTVKAVQALDFVTGDPSILRVLD